MVIHHAHGSKTLLMIRMQLHVLVYVLTCAPHAARLGRVGRAAVCAQRRHRSGRGSRALRAQIALHRGEARIQRSTLLDRAAHEARHARVLRGRGARAVVCACVCASAVCATPCSTARRIRRLGVSHTHRHTLAPSPRPAPPAARARARTAPPSGHAAPPPRPRPPRAHGRHARVKHAGQIWASHRGQSAQRPRPWGGGAGAACAAAPAAPRCPRGAPAEGKQVFGTWCGVSSARWPIRNFSQAL